MSELKTKQSQSKPASDVASNVFAKLWTAKEAYLLAAFCLLLGVALGAVASIALEPVRANMDFGQINVMLMALIVFDALKVRGRGRGVLVGVAAGHVNTLHTLPRPEGVERVTAQPVPVPFSDKLSDLLKRSKG